MKNKVLHLTWREKCLVVGKKVLFISFFSCACDHTPDKNHLKEEEFICILFHVRRDVLSVCGSSCEG